MRYSHIRIKRHRVTTVGRRFITESEVIDFRVLARFKGYVLLWRKGRIRLPLLIAAHKISPDEGTRQRKHEKAKETTAQSQTSPIPIHPSGCHRDALAL